VGAERVNKKEHPMGKYYKGPDPEEVAKQINEEFYAEQRKLALEKKQYEVHHKVEPLPVFKPVPEQPLLDDSVNPLLLSPGKYDYWYPHPRGVIIRVGNQYRLNGELLHDGDCDTWDISYSQGIIFKLGNQLLLDWKKLLYEGEFRSWHPHPMGVIIRNGNRLLLNGEILLYDGETGFWCSHPQGVIVQIDNQILLNGKELLYCGNYFYPHPQGMIIRNNNQFLLNGKKLLYEGPWSHWYSHPQGVIVRIGNQILLNGKELLYTGDCNYWLPHPQGVIVETCDRQLSLYFRGKNGKKTSRFSQFWNKFWRGTS
jgi:hypothetical protein